MTDTRILTALYADHAAAERAAERLRAIGVPEHHIEMHRSDEGDVVPGQHVTSGGLFGALSGLLVPESDLRGYERGLAGGCTVVVASHVPPDRVRAARQALDEDALEVDAEREAIAGGGGRRRDRHRGRLRPGDRRGRPTDRRADRRGPPAALAPLRPALSAPEPPIAA